MKTALCLSGQSRSINECIDSLLRFIIEPLNADVFFHTWETSQVPLYMKNWYGKEVRWPDFEYKIIEKLNPKTFIVEPQKYFDESLFRENCNPQNSRMQAVNFQHLQSMTYSIKMANALKKRHESLNDFKYDCVIRVRPDMKFAKSILQECFDDLSKLYYFKEDCHGGLNDRFAISNSENMDKYAECFDNLHALFLNGSNFHPESLLKAHLDLNKIQYQGIQTIGNLIR